MNVVFLVFVILINVVAIFATPVSENGKLKISGTQIVNSSGSPVQLRGMSLFWNNWAGKFWNSGIVNSLANDWNGNIIRAAYGISDDGTPYGSEGDVNTVVDAAISAGIYVIIDWHAHHATNNTDAAKNFFSKMAQKYGNKPNVLFEIWNEPVDVEWSTIKWYANQIVPEIRKYSSNIIIVGTPNWSQDVDIAANDKVSGSNIAYALHFYAGSHGKWLRDKGDKAINSGACVFVTEWGTCDASGNGGYNQSESDAWLGWMDYHKISWCNWSINDKSETASIFNSGASSNTISSSNLSQSGNYVMNKIKTQNPKYSSSTSGSGSSSGSSGTGNSSDYVVFDDFENSLNDEDDQTHLGAMFDYYNSANDKYFDAGYWYAYSDNKSGGTSKATPDIENNGLKGNLNNSGYKGKCLNVSINLGKAIDEWNTAYYGIGANVVADGVGINFSKMTKIEFMAKGSGSYFLKFITDKSDNIGSWGDMVAPFSVSSSWSKVSISPSDIVPEPWSPDEEAGLTWNDARGSVSKIHWQTNGDDMKAGDNGTLAIDDIKIYGMKYTDFEWGSHKVVGKVIEKSSITSTMKPFNSNKLIIAPNPVVQGSKLIVNGVKDGNYKVIFYNINQTKLLSQNLNVENSIKVVQFERLNMKKGIYFVALYNKDKVIAITRFVKVQ